LVFAVITELKTAISTVGHHDLLLPESCKRN
jgi:hypothetical protein